MATLGTNWPTIRPLQQHSEVDILRTQNLNNQHFLANRPGASQPRRPDANPYHTSHGRFHNEVTDRPQYSSYARSASPPPLLSPIPIWHQLRVPAWLESHDRDSKWQQAPAAHDNQNEVEDQRARRRREEQREAFRSWSDARKSEQEIKHTRAIELVEGKRQARAQRFAEAKVRNRERKERWKALARKAEEGGDVDLVMED